MEPLPHRHASRSVRLLGLLTGAGLAAGVLGGWALFSWLTGNDATRPQAAAANVPPIVSTAAFEQRAGVRIVHVALTGGGGLVDLRYQVLDAGRATVIHSTQPAMVDERTGAFVDRLLMGHSHKGTLRAGQTYYLLFENPGDLVQRGSKLTIALGGLRVRHVPVE